jgi:starch phosphorylase
MKKINRPAVAYFSMEIALYPDMPTYSGGLGMLAGDTLRAAADLDISMIAVTLLHRQGYFAQSLDVTGWQHEGPIPWNIEQYCHELPIRTKVTIEGRHVQLRAWKYEVTGCGKHVIPVFFAGY